MIEQLPSLKNEESLTSYFSKFSNVVRQTNEKATFKNWLARVGIGSRITLKHILAGRRRVPAEKFKAALDLSFVEANEFARVSNGEKPAVDTGKSAAHYVVSEDFFKTPLNTIVLNLCGLTEPMSRERIHEILGAGFAPADIDASVTNLVNLKLVARDESGQLRRIFEGTLRTLPGAKSTASRDYFDVVNQLSTKAWAVPLELRELQSFTLRIDQNDLGRLKDLARKFRSDCATLSSPESRDSVYQASVSLFPIFIGEKR